MDVLFEFQIRSFYFYMPTLVAAAGWLLFRPKWTWCGNRSNKLDQSGHPSRTRVTQNWIPFT